jgi:outer membrane protein assembly factor BamB
MCRHEHIEPSGFRRRRSQHSRIGPGMIRSAVLGLILPGLIAQAEDWPQFRGPGGDGRSSETNLPTTWSERQNIQWKVAIPGRGWSSPVVAGGEVWLTAAADGNRSLRLLSLDAVTGRIRTDVEVFRVTEPVTGHEKNSAASPTPLIEGDRVYVHFGSYGTACVRRDGTILWRTQELKFAQVHGPGGSPALYQNRLIINCDGHDRQFVAALDTDTGKVVWTRPRPSAMAYSTPLVIRTPNGAQVVSPGAHRAVSYNPATGEELWFVSYGDGFSNVPRPVFAHGMAYVTTGFYSPKLLAVRTNGEGDVSSTHVAWRYERGVPLTPSPVIAGHYLYMVSDNGIATCLNAVTGQELWRQRLSGSYSASPVFADGKIWFLSEDGETNIIVAGKEFKRLAINTLEGRFLASMAVSSGAVFLRSDTHLYRIGHNR